MISHNEAEALISARLDSSLDSDIEQILENHLADCAECRAFAASSRRLTNSLYDLPTLPPSQAVREGVWKTIDQPPRWWSQFGIAVPSQTAAIASTAVIALLIIAFATLAIVRITGSGDDQQDSSRLAAGTSENVALATEPAATEPPRPTDATSDATIAPTVTPSTADEQPANISAPVDNTSEPVPVVPTEDSAEATNTEPASTDQPSATDEPADAAMPPSTTQAPQQRPATEQSQSVQQASETEPATSAPPSATTTPIPPTPTSTQLPPAATSTQLPPTPTSTPIPATATSTPSPPTSTPAPPTEQDDAPTDLTQPSSTAEPTGEPTLTPTSIVSQSQGSGVVVPPARFDPNETPTESSTETPAPTETPVPPTETPVPTETPLSPTETPVPTETPLPPTETPVSTESTSPPIEPIDGSVIESGPEPTPSPSPAPAVGGTDNQLETVEPSVTRQPEDGQVIAPSDTNDDDDADRSNEEGSQQDQVIEPIDQDGTTTPDDGQPGDSSQETQTPTEVGSITTPDDPAPNADGYALSEAPVFSAGQIYGDPASRLALDGDQVVFLAFPDSSSIEHEVLGVESVSEGDATSLAICANGQCTDATAESSAGVHTDVPLGWIGDRLIYQRIGSSGAVELREVVWTGAPSGDRQLGVANSQLQPVGRAYPGDNGVLIPTNTAWLLVTEGSASVVGDNPYGGDLRLVRSNYIDNLITYVAGGQIIIAERSAPGTAISTVPFNGVDYDLSPDTSSIAISTGSSIEIWSRSGDRQGTSQSGTATGSLVWLNNGIVFLDLTENVMRVVDPSLLAP